MSCTEYHDQLGRTSCSVWAPRVSRVSHVHPLGSSHSKSILDSECPRSPNHSRPVRQCVLLVFIHPQNKAERPY